MICHDLQLLRLDPVVTTPAKCCNACHPVSFSSSMTCAQALQILRDRLLDEAEASVQLNAEVANNWGKLFRYCHKCPCSALAAKTG